MIFVNLKTYKQGTGQGALDLTKICQTVSKETSVEIICLVQTVDLFRLSSQGFGVWAQHLDGIEFGPNTGSVLPEAVLGAGAKGTLLNHSENKLPIQMVKILISRCQKLGLKTLVCADSVKEAEAIMEVNPDFLGYEPPEFIGSQTDSVATAKPEVIKEFVERFREVPVLVGAGIHSQKDVEISLSLGVKGINIIKLI